MHGWCNVSPVPPLTCWLTASSLTVPPIGCYPHSRPDSEITPTNPLDWGCYVVGTSSRCIEHVEKEEAKEAIFRAQLLLGTTTHYTCSLQTSGWVERWVCFSHFTHSFIRLQYSVTSLSCFIWRRLLYSEWVVCFEDEGKNHIHRRQEFTCLPRQPRFRSSTALLILGHLCLGDERIVNLRFEADVVFTSIVCAEKDVMFKRQEKCNIRIEFG